MSEIPNQCYIISNNFSIEINKIGGDSFDFNVDRDWIHNSSVHFFLFLENQTQKLKYKYKGSNTYSLIIKIKIKK